MDNTKICNCCKLSLPLDQYSDLSPYNGKIYKCYICKKCKVKKQQNYIKDGGNEKRKEWRYSKKGKISRIKSQNTYVKKFHDLKRDKPCVDCGKIFHPCAMDFDHINNNKEFSIAEKRHLPKELLLEEISKCELVCSNCHRIRTYKRVRQRWMDEGFLLEELEEIYT